jgi:hypothetical protein
MSRMTYMRSWKSHRLTSHTRLGLNPQIGRPLSRIVVPLVYFLFLFLYYRVNVGAKNTSFLSLIKKRQKIDCSLKNVYTKSAFHHLLAHISSSKFLPPHSCVSVCLSRCNHHRLLSEKNA